MGDCRHWDKVDGPEGYRHCKDCNLIFETNPVFSGSITIGKMEASYTVPNKGGMLNVSALIREYIGTDKINVTEVYAIVDDNRYYNRAVKVKFSVGPSNLLADVIYDTRNEYEETGSYFEPPVEVEETA